MPVDQPPLDQVLDALELNGVSVTSVLGYELEDDGDLVVQLDEGGGVVLSRSEWSPSRMCIGAAACVGQRSCPLRSPCTA